MQQKKTLVIGASENPERYSNKAIHMLRGHGHEVVAIGNREGQVDDVTFGKDKTVSKASTPLPCTSTRSGNRSTTTISFP